MADSHKNVPKVTLTANTLYIYIVNMYLDPCPNRPSLTMLLHRHRCVFYWLYLQSVLLLLHVLQLSSLLRLQLLNFTLQPTERHTKRKTHRTASHDVFYCKSHNTHRLKMVSFMSFYDDNNVIYYSTVLCNKILSFNAHINRTTLFWAFKTFKLLLES